MATITPVLIHKPVLFIEVLPPLRSLADDRALAYLEKRLFCALDDETRVPDFLDPADDAAVGDDLVAILQARDHLFELCLLLSLRHDHQKVKDAAHQKQRDQKAEYRAAARILK